LLKRPKAPPGHMPASRCCFEISTPQMILVTVILKASGPDSRGIPLKLEF